MGKRWKLWAWIGKKAPAWVRDELHKAYVERSIEARELGIRVAAEVAADYDHLSAHDHLVSDCILSKLGVTGDKPRKNTAGNDAKRLSEISSIMEAVDLRCAARGSVTGTKEEITNSELLKIWRLAKGLRSRPRRLPSRKPDIKGDWERETQ